MNKQKLIIDNTIGSDSPKYTFKELESQLDITTRALKDIIKHQEIVAGTKNFRSVTATIARKALQEIGVKDE